ncbi:MAG: hypothetical protein GXX94_00700 [Chloroflexi bacterium]|nr:hypothetical protein [Chloroflexota bacterium]
MFSLAQRRAIQWVWAALGVIAFIGATLYAIRAHLSVPVLPIDDGYIHLRHARNILDGLGPVYQSGARVMGSSSPLYVLWLTFLGALARLFGGRTGPAPGGPLVAGLPTIAVRANAFWYVACMVAMAGVIRTMLGCRGVVPAPADTPRGVPDPRWGLALVLAAAATLFSPMLAVSTGVMESFMWGALVLGALWAQAGDRPRTAAVLTGLAAVARPEGLLLLCLWGVRWLASCLRTALHGRDSDRSWLEPVLELVLALWPLLAWLVFSCAYYGSPLPHSVLAKASGLYPLGPEYVPDTLRELFRAWAGGGALSWNPPGSVPAGGGFLSLVQGVTRLLALVGVFALSDLRRAAAWAPGLLLGMLCLFYISARTMLLEWYLPLIWVLWYPAIFGGAWAIGVALLRWARTRPSPWRIGTAVLVSGLVALVFVRGPARAAVELLQRPDVATIVLDDPVRLRTLAYLDAAVWLNEHAPEGARLAGTEIGTLGYYYGGYLIDSCALVSPEALRYLPVPMAQRYSAMDGVIANELVQDLEPDYVASMPTFAGASIMRDRWFSSHYALAAEFPLPKELWGSSSVLVWEHVLPAVTR